MLYDRWLEVVGENGSNPALTDLATGEQWSFRQLARAADSGDNDPGGIVCPRGASKEFIVQLLRAWRTQTVVCPLEPGQPVPAIAPPPEEIIHLKTTSASSGAAKVVAFTASQLAADARNIVETMNLRPEQPNLGVISLAHSYGFSSLVTPLLLHGIPLILAGSGLPEAVRSALAAYPALTLPAVPALWRAWHEANVLSDSVRLAISAGAALPLAVEKGILESTSIKLRNFYGATECGGIAFDDSSEPREDGAAIGTPLRNVNLTCGTSGLLEVRGAAVGECYWPEGEATLVGGCFKTSDLADLRDGKVFLRGRAGDQINVAGRKVSPEGIEALLASHPDVQQCVVFGVPSGQEGRGEDIVACVAASEASLDSLKAFLSSRLEGWKLPRHWWLMGDMGVSVRGKISRAEWRRKYLERGSAGSGSASA